jgi:hypothetical protein
MENHIYKHDWRHGHHHHKNNTFFAMMAMIFFGLIALGVVASIYYNFDNEQVKCQGSKCVQSQNNDQQSGQNIFANEQRQIYSARNQDGQYINPAGLYMFTIPAGMEVVGDSDAEISVVRPGEKWAFAVSFVVNLDNMTLAQAFDDVYEQLKPDEYSEYTLKDMKRSDISVNGIPAKQLSIDNFGDGGSTLIVIVHQGNIYVLRGTLRDDLSADYDMNNYVSTFRLIR